MRVEVEQVIKPTVPMILGHCSEIRLVVARLGDRMAALGRIPVKVSVFV